jgi:hypothetical protein
MKFKNIATYNLNDRLHSFDDKPLLEIFNNRFDKVWFKDGVPHRINGPAMIGENDYVWYVYGETYGVGEEPPEWYLKRMESMGIEFVRGSDE